jgi:hypothetical protein
VFEREEMEHIGRALAQRLREVSMPPDDAYWWARIVAHEALALTTDDEKAMAMNKLPLIALLALVAVPAYAQTPLLPGQVISFEVDPGTKQESPTSPNVIARPEANLAFEYRIDGATALVPAVKHAPCTPVSASSPVLTCRLKPPTLAAGTHTIEVRALTSPAEPGVSPSGFSAPPLSVAVVIVTAPGTPSNPRVTSVP